MSVWPFVAFVGVFSGWRLRYYLFVHCWRICTVSSHGCWYSDFHSSWGFVCFVRFLCCLIYHFSVISFPIFLSLLSSCLFLFLSLSWSPFASLLLSLAWSSLRSHFSRLICLFRFSLFSSFLRSVVSFGYSFSFVLSFSHFFGDLVSSFGSFLVSLWVGSSSFSFVRLILCLILSFRWLFCSSSKRGVGCCDLGLFFGGGAGVTVHFNSMFLFSSGARDSLVIFSSFKFFWLLTVGCCLFVISCMVPSLYCLS